MSLEKRMLTPQIIIIPSRWHLTWDGLDQARSEQILLLSAVSHSLLYLLVIRPHASAHCTRLPFIGISCFLHLSELVGTH
ncbi:hypothetical protein ACTXT7_000474 [Hymenolepis weldensis]